MPRWAQLPNRGGGEWTMFRPPFLGLSPEGASRADPKKGCLDVLEAHRRRSWEDVWSGIAASLPARELIIVVLTLRIAQSHLLYK